MTNLCACCEKFNKPSNTVVFTVLPYQIRVPKYSDNKLLNVFVYKNYKCHLGEFNSTYLVSCKFYFCVCLRVV